MLTTTKPRATDDLELFDESSLAAELDGLAKQHGSNEQALRRAITQPLKNALATGRAGAERLLLQDRQGRRCAERLCQMQDDDHPHRVRVRRPSPLSVAEPVRSGAHGDRRDRRLRPRADGAGLRHRSPVPAALQADRVGRVGRGGDPLLPVGSRSQGRSCHALGRRVHPPSQGGHDDPHRAAGVAVSARRQQAVRRADDAVRQVGRAGHRRRNSSPPSSPSARRVTAAPVNRAIWSSPTSRTARAACATCTRCSGSPSTSTASATSRS